MDFNIWIDKNEIILDNIVNTILYYLNTYKNKFNYTINDNLPNDLINYIYDTSINKYDKYD